MAHQYQLHQKITVQCWCCRSPQEFVFSSPSDQVVCSHCVAHTGNTHAERRDADHVQLWSDLYARALAEHAAQTAAADQTIALLIAELDAAKEQVAQFSAVLARDFDQTQSAEVRAILETDLVKSAERKTDAALLRYDRAMAALWRISTQHQLSDAKPQPNQPLRCSCGKPVTECVEWAALESVRQLLESWEAKQQRHLAAGERHALPSEHPDVQTSTPISPRNSGRRR
ncbi:hypothetical protein [Leifsonia sp. A12D58]|uniref:hypothetical protein n=1 Tax=Leifsonia sp. A12D58 TaxID=3397674 RepID=UPI0039E0AE54